MFCIVKKLYLAFGGNIFSEVVDKHFSSVKTII